VVEITRRANVTRSLDSFFDEWYLRKGSIEAWILLVAVAASMEIIDRKKNQRLPDTVRTWYDSFFVFSFDRTCVYTHNVPCILFFVCTNPFVTRTKVQGLFLFCKYIRDGFHLYEFISMLFVYLIHFVVLVNLFLLFNMCKQIKNTTWQKYF
jgi:hypothetical protein